MGEWRPFAHAASTGRGAARRRSPRCRRAAVRCCCCFPAAAPAWERRLPPAELREQTGERLTGETAADFRMVLLDQALAAQGLGAFAAASRALRNLTLRGVGLTAASVGARCSRRRDG